MSFFWFILAVVFFVLWLNARSKRQENGTSEGYGQGYWDGYRAFGAKLSALLEDSVPTRHELKRLIDEGNGVAQSTEEAQTQATQREELGIIPEGTSEYVDEYDVQPEAVQRPAPVPQPVVSAEALAEQKAKETLRNLNVLLYVASFLIVAAAALFVTLVMPANVKLAALIFVAAAFYIGGMVLHAQSSRLRPAAVAFVGTGLAVLPFVGFALTSLGGVSGEVAWLITSCVGLVAYGVAAVRLQSELVSYLTMAFVVSLALSAVSTLGLSMIWYFISVIGVSLLCSSASILWPQLLPKVFAQPVEQTGQIATPITLLASLFATSAMDIFMYEVLYGVATAHYLVVWLQRRENLYEVVVRLLAHVTLLIVAYDVTQMGVSGAATTVGFGIWFAVLAVVQASYSLIRRGEPGTDDRQVAQLFVGVMIVLLWAGMCWWSGSDDVYWLSAGSLATSGVLSLAATMRFRQVGWAYAGLAVSLVLPFVLGRGAAEPPVSYEVIAGGFVILGIFALMGLERARALSRSRAVQTMLALAVAAYALATCVSGMLSYDAATIGWTALLGAALFVTLSYVLRIVAVEVGGIVLGLVSIASWTYKLVVAAEWQGFVTLVVVAAVLAVGAWIHHFTHERSRRDMLAGFAAALLACLVCLAFYADTVVLRTATTVLLAATFAGLALRQVARTPGSILQLLGQLTYLGYPVLATLIAWQAGEGWFVLALAVLVAVLWIGSYIEKTPALLGAGNVVLVGMLTMLWSWLKFDPEWQVYGTMWIAAVVFYVTYWLMVDKKDVWRQKISLISVFVVLAIAVCSGLLANSSELVLSAVGSLFAAAVVLAVQGYRENKRDYIEAAVYMGTFALQRMVSVLLPETNLVAYGHWWAVTIALVAWWRHEDYRSRLVVALAFVTGSTGVYALMGEAGYPMLFLVEHLLVLTVGAVTRKAWAMWWGVIAVVLAVLYFLRDYTFLAPLFLGILLIIFVVWRLTKMGK